MLQRYLFDTSNIFEKLKHGFIIIDCRESNKWWQQVQTSVDILTGFPYATNTVLS